MDKKILPLGLPESVDSSSFTDVDQTTILPEITEIFPGIDVAIKIERGKEFLGLVLLGGCNTEYEGVFIQDLLENGKAAKDGRLRRGDQILKVDNKDYRNIKHEKAVVYLSSRSREPTVTLVIHRHTDVVSAKTHEELYDIYVTELKRKYKQPIGFGIQPFNCKSNAGFYIQDTWKGTPGRKNLAFRYGDHFLEIDGEDISDLDITTTEGLLKFKMLVTPFEIHKFKMGRLKKKLSPSTHKQLQDISDEEINLILRNTIHNHFSSSPPSHSLRRSFSLKSIREKYCEKRIVKPTTALC